MLRTICLILALTLALPAQAKDQNLASIQMYLANLAQQNGQVYAQHVPHGTPTPTTGQALTAIHSIARPTVYQVEADPTAAELPFILPGATDGDGMPVPDPVPGLIFGTLHPNFTDAYGIDHYGDFDDLSNANIPEPTIEVPIDPTDLDQGNDIVCNPAYKEYVDYAAAYQAQVEAQADIDAAAQEAENQIIPDQTIIYTPIAYAKSLVEYNKHYGLIHTADATYCMYGSARGLNTAECWKRGKVYAFNPLMVLKQMPQARTDKALKAAAAYMVVRHKRRA